MLVHLLDKGDNEAGIGIRVEFPQDRKDRPTAEEKGTRSADHVIDV